MAYPYDSGYGPNPARSGSDPRGRLQNQTQYQQQRFESQQGPMANAMAYNYGRGSEADFGNYNNLMNQYMNIASGGGSGSSGGGGGGGGHTPFLAKAGKAGYVDPFNSYKDFQEWSKTGGYSPEDIANMRARGMSPIRAAYANAERNIGQQRSLQGGYSPNAIAAQTRMAREQGQSAADAVQNVEAGLAQARNQGRQFGLTGMQGVETSRLGADVDISKFNTGLGFEASKFNAQARAQAQAANNAARAASSARASQMQMAALNGASNLYGTTPGMSSLFGNQLMGAVNSGGNFGLGLMDRDYNSQNLPGQWDTTRNRINDVVRTGGGAAYPWLR